MKLLSYDTSSDVLSVSIHEGATLVAELNDASLGRHSNSLAPSLERLLKERRMVLKDIHCLAIGLGPGSFTGLRVGITTAKMLAYASGMKIVGVPSLETIARGVSKWEGPIAVLLDARKGKVYAALYEKNEETFKVIDAPRLIKIEDFLKKIKKPAYFTGGAVPIYREKLEQGLKSHFHWEEPSQTLFPKARDMAEAAFRFIRQKKFIDPFKLEPLYLHPRDCNVMVRP